METLQYPMVARKGMLLFGFVLLGPFAALCAVGATQTTDDAFAFAGFAGVGLLILFVLGVAVRNHLLARRGRHITLAGDAIDVPHFALDQVARVPLAGIKTIELRTVDTGPVKLRSLWLHRHSGGAVEIREVDLGRANFDRLHDELRARRDRTSTAAVPGAGCIS